MNNYDKKKIIVQIREKYSRELDIILAIFILSVFISNLTEGVFHFRLVYIFQLTFDAFHDFCHSVLHFFIFSWFNKIIETLWYGILLVKSFFFPTVIKWPKIIIPGTLLDLALLSLVLTRIFGSVDFFVPRSERELAEAQMTQEQWKGIKKAEGSFWGPIHRFVERLNAEIWKLINNIQRFIGYPIRNYPKLESILRRILISFAGVILMWGYIRLIGYTINVCAAGRLKSPIMEMRKKFYKYFLLCFIGAVLASASFFFMCGWLVDMTNTHPVPDTIKSNNVPGPKPSQK